MHSNIEIYKYFDILNYMVHDKTTQTVVLLKALADDIRLGIVRDIARQPEAVASCDIVGGCARRTKLSQPAMSHHFKRLVDAEILLVEKHGTENRYRCNMALLQQHGIDIAKL